MSSKNNNSPIFDKALGEIVNIIVSYDMGWSKRGNGRSYDSLNGYGAIIGMLSGKVLDYATRNRKCKKCDLGHSESDHDCRKNFQGSAKAMEASVGAQLINNSSILEAAGVKVRVVIGDEDSSTMAAVRKENPQVIYKLADRNHLSKNFVSDLYKIKPLFSEMSKKETIPHIKKCFNFAIAQNKGNASTLAVAIRSIPDHVFGKHEHCGDWCHKDGHKITLTNEALYSKLLDIFSKYAANSSKLCVAASSQANEALNSIMAHKCPKKTCFSLTASADARMASAVCTKNDGDRHVTSIENILNVSPGKHNATYAEKRDKLKLAKSAKSKLRSMKLRRNILKQGREVLRKKLERSEGVQYRPNYGFELDVNSNEIPNLQEDKTKVIYFDLETSGFGYSADILQIAAVCEENSFCVYVTPTQTVHAQAQRITGFKNVGGELYCRDKKVDSIPLHDALRSFLQFLSVSGQPCLLVAHNANFDCSHLLLATQKYGMTREFQTRIAGFSDTYLILKKLHPTRKGQGMFKLERLANDLININGKENFHDALFDVQVLKELVTSCIPRKTLFENRKSFMEKCEQLNRSQNSGNIAKFLQPLKEVVSAGMIKKIANAGITFEKLKETHLSSRAVLEIESRLLTGNDSEFWQKNIVIRHLVSSVIRESKVVFVVIRKRDPTQIVKSSNAHCVNPRGVRYVSTCTAPYSTRKTQEIVSSKPELGEFVNLIVNEQTGEKQNGRRTPSKERFLSRNKTLSGR
ncbi:uncharacterized protein [Venturia canescens]|uniref:uncharacterized protein n=1 Tax=Venturia canescens TaxID=32260 RepID=UPI001C9BBF05|nr:uncharacterized protein LOC122416245 [Venturia canescens]